ncbi:MAG: tRNA (cytidine(34)-2'-O)-methyltransferase [Magnetococcales bacterium]|nr:tRNA (cytidine(34)-2'-O)-methyltransferase [Magnetococcales bacterium]
MDTPFHVILYQPEIPPNTGNIVRLCAATHATLHLVGPLGFRLDGAAVRRAGMDYREWAAVRRWDDWAHYWHSHPPTARLFPISTHGTQAYSARSYQMGDRFLFGAEGSGLPDALREAHRENLVRIPMVAQARSLNLANSVSIMLYEALRQTGFPGLVPNPDQNPASNH